MNCSINLIWYALFDINYLRLSFSYINNSFFQIILSNNLWITFSNLRNSKIFGLILIDNLIRVSWRISILATMSNDSILFLRSIRIVLFLLICCWLVGVFRSILIIVSLYLLIVYWLLGHFLIGVLSPYRTNISICVLNWGLFLHYKYFK